MFLAGPWTIRTVACPLRWPEPHSRPYRLNLPEHLPPAAHTNTTSKKSACRTPHWWHARTCTDILEPNRTSRGRIKTQHTNTTPRDDASSSCTAASRPRPTPPAAAVAASSAPEPAVRPRELPAHAALQPPPPAAFDSCPACLPGPQPLPDRPAPRPRHDSTVASSLPNPTIMLDAASTRLPEL